MRKYLGWRLAFAVALVGLSAITYAAHLLIFRDPRNLLFYTVMDVAFLLIEVLLVTVLLDQLVTRWERQKMLDKLNMVIETFFSEFGKRLLGHLARRDRHLERIRNLVATTHGMSPAEFRAAEEAVRGYKCDLDISRIDLKLVRRYMQPRREFLLGLLQNPNLLEHEVFTDLLRAVFHVVEELVSRDLDRLSPEDVAHLKMDLERAYDRLTAEWIVYLGYIKAQYPYYYVFAVRTNPYLGDDVSLDESSESC